MKLMIIGDEESSIAAPNVIKNVLKKFENMIPKDLPELLPPMRDTCTKLITPAF